MRKEAEVKEIIYQHGFMDVTARTKDTEEATTNLLNTIKEEVEKIGGTVVKSAAFSASGLLGIRFPINFSDSKASVRKIAYYKFDTNFFKEYLTIEDVIGVYTFLVRISAVNDKKEKAMFDDENLIDSVLNDSQYIKHPAEYSDSEKAWFKPITVKSTRRDLAYDELAYSLAHSKKMFGGVQKGVAMSNDFAQYKSMKKYPQRRDWKTDEELKEYIESSHPEYLESMQEVYEAGLSDFASVAGGILSESTNPLSDADSSIVLLESAIKNIELASWFKFRAERLEKLYAVRDYGSFFSNDDEETKAKLKELKEKLKQGTEAPLDVLEGILTKEDFAVLSENLKPAKIWCDEALNNVLNNAVQKEHNEPNVIEGVKNALDSINNIFKADRGSTRTGAKKISGVVKDGIKAAFDKLVKEVKDTKQDEAAKKEYDGYQYQVDQYIDESHNLGKYEEKDIEKLIYNKYSQIGEYDKQLEDIEQMSKDFEDREAGVYPNFLYGSYDDYKDNPRELKDWIDIFKSGLAGIEKIFKKYNKESLILSIEKLKTNKDLSEEEKQLYKNISAELNENYHETLTRVVNNFQNWKNQVKIAENRYNDIKSKRFSDTGVSYNFDWVQEPADDVESKYPEVNIALQKKDKDSIETAILKLTLLLKNILGNIPIETFLSDRKIQPELKKDVKELLGFLKKVCNIGNVDFNNTVTALARNRNVQQLARLYKILKNAADAEIERFESTETRESALQELSEIYEEIQKAILDITLKLKEADSSESFQEEDIDDLNTLSIEFKTLQKTLYNLLFNKKTVKDTEIQEQHDDFVERVKEFNTEYEKYLGVSDVENGQNLESLKMANEEMKNFLNEPRANLQLTPDEVAEKKKAKKIIGRIKKLLNGVITDEEEGEPTLPEEKLSDGVDFGELNLSKQLKEQGK